MKKGLLFVASAFLSGVSFGQLTQTNEPAVGAYNEMYKVDTTTVSTRDYYLGITGTNVEWDYTAATMNATDTKIIGVDNAQLTANASSFPTSTKAISQGTAVQYFNSSATERMSQGFVFTDPSFGEVEIIFGSGADQAKVMPYPFNYGDSNQDDYKGTVDLSALLPGTTGVVTGTIYSKIDGTGTLKLPTMNIPNLFRLTTVDTTLVDAGIMSVEVIRTQMEYYDLAVSDLPVFVDAFLSMGTMGAERQIFSKYFSSLGITNNEIANLSMYPNPSNGTFKVVGDFSNATVEVTDVAGKVIYSSAITTGATVDLKDAKSGVYFVKVAADSKTTVQKMTVK